MTLTPLESRMAYLEGAFEQIGQTLATMHRRFESIDRRFESIDRRFESIDRRFDVLDHKIELRFDTLFNALDRKIDQRFTWTIGVVLSTWLTTILAVFLRH